MWSAFLVCSSRSHLFHYLGNGFDRFTLFALIESEDLERVKINLIMEYKEIKINLNFKSFEIQSTFSEESDGNQIDLFPCFVSSIITFQDQIFFLCILHNLSISCVYDVHGLKNVFFSASVLLKATFCANAKTRTLSNEVFVVVQAYHKFFAVVNVLLLSVWRDVFVHLFP